MNLDEILEKSILVAAHPDDEILFFSSVLGRVKEVLLCYLECSSIPEWGEGRKKSLIELPLKNFSCIGLDESESFYGIDWESPVTTEYGLEISDRRISDISYKANYLHLKSYLCSKLNGYENVFTHNPWGEYGHCEHVQIYRVIKELQKEMHFNVWYSNYCSNKSFGLMLRYVSGFNSDYVTLKTDKHLAEEIRDIYKKNNCWTWYNDWIWFKEESFICDKDMNGDIKEFGHSFPLNMIKVEIRDLKKSSSFRKTVSRLLQRVTNRE